MVHALTPRARALFLATAVLVGCSALHSTAHAQDCRNGQCRIGFTTAVLPIVMTPLSPLEELTLTETNEVAASTVDRFERVVSATCRVTVSGVCGSGTVVGRDANGVAIVLTNAHVAGTQRGRVVQLQRWNPDGSSERGQGAIIAAGYRRGLSVDFALLKCNETFAQDVVPIPLADRYPDVNAGVSTYGCPRCEWPSLQVLKLTKAEGQVLRWLPEAIGGRSGSSVIDYTDHGPRVVGLLTWGGGGEGLGQSTPFILDALRGRLPTSWETLPAYAREVSTCEATTRNAGICCMPCSTDGRMFAMAQLTAADEIDASADSDLIDSIVEDGPDPKPDGDCPDDDKPDDDSQDDVKPDDDDCGLLNRDKDKDDDTGKDKPCEPGRDWIGWARDTLWMLLVGIAALAIGWIVGRFVPLPK